MTAEELKEKYGESNIYKYNIEDLPQIESVGSMNDLKGLYSLSLDGNFAGDIMVEADFPSSIYEAENPVAASVFYRIFVTPASAVSP